jgi:hypothetical protein
MKRNPNLVNNVKNLSSLLKELINDSLLIISVTLKEARFICQMFQSFPISRYNHIYLQLKASINAIENNDVEELNVLQKEVIVNCDELLNCLTVNNGEIGCTMANVLLEIKCLSELILRSNLKSEIDIDYERSIGLSNIRRLHLSKSIDKLESYSLQF